MGFLTKIFGKEDKEADKKVEQDVEKIKSGEVNKIYPILKPGDWVGIRAGCLKQTLIGTQEAPLLVAGFGYDAPSNFVFLTYAELEGKDLQPIINQAYYNLDNFKQEFETYSSPHGNILLSSGQDFSSEKILCRDHMLKAHELLNSKELYVSIPRRRTMIIMPAKASQELQDTFSRLHYKVWDDDSYGNAQIVNSWYVVADGHLKDYVRF